MKKYFLVFLIILLYSTKTFSRSEYDKIFIVKSSEPDRSILNEDIKCQYPQKKCHFNDITGKTHYFCSENCSDYDYIFS